ncbi:MAG: hypothetical protein AVDCRST_MAG87-216 [uncultured Thermomicrobiales bacterium]|uniref:Glyoxalase-like domain-containing protein n=1 Tax=uncultured Thermomicrobiales bacterium TaxID=1645740 RepID=A0A6J4U7Q2_9BACT|nr:MAG: hypothetical protein AVDCRST_MAG87-216 [uncultured Thermomicrobiales bacterium]
MVLEHYDRMIRLDLADIAVDGCITRAPRGGEMAGRRPVDRGKQQITAHLDIAVDDLETAVAWAVEAGARPAAFQPQDDVRVMLDPVGNPFCLFPDQS